jgi:hypothetical protein
MVAATSAQSARIYNTSAYRLAADTQAVNDADRHSIRLGSIVHQIADRSVLLRRRSTRRRLARIDPEAVERRAWRLSGGSAGSPAYPWYPHHRS